MRDRVLSKVLQLLEGGLTPPFRIRFEEEGHQYWIDEVNVPSVTQVVEQLHNFGGVDPQVLARAAERGVLIHRACEFLARGVLDWSTVDSSILPEVVAFQEWLEVSGFHPILVESVVGSKRYKFAGRLDLVGILKSGLCLIDIKTGGQYPAYSVQTAGLAVGLWECLGIEGVLGPRLNRYCLYLKGSTAKMVAHTDVRDPSLFFAALTCSHYRREMYP